MTPRKPLFKYLCFVVVLFSFFPARKILINLRRKKNYPAANSNNQNGHLQQTKTFSSDVVLKWMDMQLRVIQSTTGMPPATNSVFLHIQGLLYMNR